jgi:hypothetical protein
MRKYSPPPNVYELLKTLSLEEKEELLKYLQKSVEEEKYGPPKYYLETEWERIKGNLYLLSFEPYIDDQTELLDVWDSCEFLAKDPETQKVPWEIRRRILMEMDEANRKYDFGLDDPMDMLENALIQSDEEEILLADLLFQKNASKNRATHIYRTHGLLDRCIDHIESTLGRDPEPYMEVINYFRERDPERAKQAAMQGLENARRDLTDIVIFLVEQAFKNNDTAELEELLAFAKKKSNVSYTRVKNAFRAL